MNFDLIITNGRVFDGSGKEEIRADIGVTNDQIAEIGDLSAATADTVIDAAGCIVCPGFIDAHSHSDTYLLLEPTAASKVYQGITTEVCGNCGASAAPLNGTYKMPSDWLDKDYSNIGRTADLQPAPQQNRTAGDCAEDKQSSPAPPWSTVAEYRNLYAQADPAINVALLVGHNTLHAGSCGYEPRAGTAAEMQHMIKTLEQAFDEGAIGLSSGLAYPPGSAVPREEIIELARIAAQYDTLYTTHMRSESNGLLEAIDESIDIAQRSGARLQISHLKTSGAGNWNKLPAALEKIHTAANRIEIGSDRYPYTAGSTDLDILLPQWATYGGRDAILARIRDPQTRRKLRDEFSDNPPDYWDNVMVGSTQYENFKGKYLPEIAESLGLETVDAFLHLIDTDELKTGGIFFSMSEENMWKILAEPYVSLGSDGSMRAPWGPLSQDHPHPRAYGSHTKFLRAAIDGQTVPLPEAIRKMTSLPAAQFKFKNRGLLKKGCAADIVIFDPAAIKENTTYAQPHQLSDGIRDLLVNGTHTLKNGIHTPQRNGRFLAGKR